MPSLRTALAERGAAVLQARPGAGKTTLVPLRLLDEPWLAGDKIVVMEPRRVAARAAAMRMAALLGEQVGATVGYATRDDRKIGRATRVEVVTDGIFTRRIQSDPSLSGTALVVFDEFHERHLEADLGLALALDAREVLRPELRVLVMSATLDAAPVADLLGGAPVLSSEGQSFPVEVRWEPRRPDSRLEQSVARVVRAALARDPGDILVFLPGIGEIRAVAAVLGELPGVEVLELHGGLPAAAQDRVLQASTRRRVVLSTDLAETSVTVQGVGVVIDAGLLRRPAYELSSGLNRLRTSVASRASADQRAGRAGRTGPGVAYRLWSPGEHAARRAWSEPEIANADLAPLVLELAEWGTAAGSLKWLDPPPAAALSASAQLLDALGALEGGRVTELGRSLAELPLHPRLARMLLAAPASQVELAALLAALVSEREILQRGRDEPPLSADLASRLEIARGGVGNDAHQVDRAALALVRRRADELARRLGATRSSRQSPRGHATMLEENAGSLLAFAYPDRIAQSRGDGRYRLRQGGGAVLPEHDPLARAGWLVAAEVEAPVGGLGRADGRIRLAAELDKADVERIGARAIRTHLRYEWDEQLDDLRVTSEQVLDALVLERLRIPPTPGPETAAALLAHVVRAGLVGLGWTTAARTFQARVGWARRSLGESWPDVSDAALVARADEWLAPLLTRARGRDDLARVDPLPALRGMLGARSGELDRLLPKTVELESGRQVPIDYEGERPRISVRVQELFGTKVHPSIGGGKIPITVELLSPAGRPIQITADLPGFWRGSWREVRREMAGRYPKHPWPEDPTDSPPTNRGRGSPRR